MKRLLVFLVVAIVTVSLGFTTYAFVKNNEQIKLVQANYFINAGDTFEINFDVVNRKKQTEYTYKIGETQAVEITSRKNVFKGVAGGKYTVEITTTNNRYPTFTVSVVVGDGSAEYPYFLKTKEEFLSLGSERFPLTANYKMVNDIDLDGTNFVGFGDLTGNFNGGNFKIMNANYDATTNATVKTTMALFNSVAENSVVENVTLENFNYNGAFTSVAVLTTLNNGTLNNINITNCKITNTATNGVSAGVAVTNQTLSNTAKIQRVACDVEITAQNLVGGLCVNNLGAIVTNSYTKGALNATDAASYVAGLILTNQSQTNALSYVKDCYSISKIAQNAIGRASLILTNSTSLNADYVIMGCYFAPELTLCEVGINKLESANNNYASITQDNLKNLENLVSYSYATTKVLWNNDIWYVDDLNDGYPQINYEAAPVADKFLINTMDYQVTTAEELIEIFKNPTTATDRYIICADIDLKDKVTAPLGTVDGGVVTFNGILEAAYNQAENRYYKISNVTITDGYTNNALIGVTGATAQLINITLENVSIKSGVNLGALVGVNNGLIDNCQILNTDTSTLGGSEAVITTLGGVCGVNNGSIVNSKSSILLEPITYMEKVNVGGICGINNGFIFNVECGSEIACSGAEDINLGGIAGSSYGNINSCLFNGMITADMNAVNTVGGICAYSAESARFVRCRSAATLEGYQVAGIVAFSQKSEVKECAVTGMLTGDKVGGISYRAPEIVINDVSVVCEMFGRDDNSLKAGIATELFHNKLSYCGATFLAVTFDDIGKNFTTSYYVTNTAWIWEWNPNSIAVRRAVFDKTVMSNAKRWVLFDVALLDKLPVNDDGGCSTEVCTGQQASTVYSDRNFSNKVWNFAEGSYPTLKNCK